MANKILYSHNTFTYCILFEIEDEMEPYGKIGRTNNLFYRLRSLEYVNGKKINITRSFYFCTDIEDLLKNGTKHYLHSGTEYRFERGIILARKLAKMYGHDAIHLGMYYKDIDSQKMKIYMSSHHKAENERLINNQAMHEREICVECQHLGIPHPARQYFLPNDWQPTNPPKMHVEYRELYDRLKKLRGLCLKIFLSFIDDQSRQYFKVADWNPLEAESLIYGWYQAIRIQYDHRHWRLHPVFTDKSNLVATKAITFISKYHKSNGDSVVYELAGVLPLKKNIKHSSVRRLIRVYKEAKFVGDTLESIIFRNACAIRKYHFHEAERLILSANEWAEYYDYHPQSSPILNAQPSG